MDNQECARSSTPEISSQKRPRGSPTLQTPYRKSKRIPLRQLDQNGNSLSPRVLSQTFSRRSKKTKEKWTDAELKALTEFVLLHGEGDAWPAHKQDEFWRRASEFVQTRSGQTTCRTGMGYMYILLYTLSPIT